jgi:electron transfer flavoprotein alpha/beta subunit
VTKQLRREGAPLNLNPFDAAAVAHAAAHEDAEAIATTMGPPQAEAGLRTCLALGADRCIPRHGLQCKARRQIISACA